MAIVTEATLYSYKPMFKNYVLVLTEAIVSLVEFLLGLRVILKFLGAFTSAPFVRWVYETTGPLLAPFNNMFPSSPLARGAEIEVSALFALVIYAFAGFLIESAINRLSSLENN